MSVNAPAQIQSSASPNFDGSVLSRWPAGNKPQTVNDMAGVSGSTSMALSWTSIGIPGVLQKRESGGVWEDVQSLNSYESSYRVSGLSPLTDYEFRIVNEYGNSSEVLATTLSGPMGGDFTISGVSASGGVGTVSGSGFGVKDPIILYDLVDTAYEMGTENSYFSTYNDMQPILASEVQNNSSAIWQAAYGEGETYIQKTSPFKRYPGKAQHYYGSTGEFGVGDPYIWPQSGTPTTENKMYLSWWFRQENDTLWYQEHEMSNLSAGFNPQKDDRFIVDVGEHWSGVTQVGGRVVNWDPVTKNLAAVFDDPGQSNNNRLEGKVLTLNGSGESATLLVGTEWRGANKFIRSWNSEGEAGSFRLSVVQTGVSGANANLPVGESRWAHIELLVDLLAQKWIFIVDGATQIEYDLNEDLIVPGHSPTIGWIGFDASVDLFQKCWMDEIYLDKSWRRVTLSNASSSANITHEEVQRYTAWSDGSITFDIKYGALDTGQPVYCYVYDENNIPNADGVLI